MPKQFSLRLMLVVVTALSIALGVWGIPAERQRRAVQAIQAVGGKVGYVSRSSFLGQWLPQDYLHDISAVSLTGTHVTDDELAHVEPLLKVRLLLLADAPVTDAGLLHLEGLTALEELSFVNIQATDEGIARLRKALPKCKIVVFPDFPGQI
jgi:hypothetical protein